MSRLLRLGVVLGLVTFAHAVSVPLSAVSDGNVGLTVSAVKYFKSGSSVVISGLSGDCQIRMRAAEKTAPASPGTYSAWTAGKLDEDDDSKLESYGHHWQGSTASSVTYSSLPDGYYMFTASCGAPYTDANDLLFKIDTVAPTATLTPAYDYDPSPKTLGSYKFTVAITDTHGSSPVYSKAREVTYGPELAGLKYKWRVDSGSWHKPTNYPGGAIDTLDIGFKEPGPHCLEVMAIDNAGHDESYYSTYCWMVESHVKNDGCTYKYSVNGAEYVSTEDTFATMENLPDGTNSFAVKAVDMYGQETVDGAINTFTWTVDTALPTTTITSGWASTEVPTSTKGTFSYTSSETGFYKYQVDSGAIVTAPTATTQSFASGTFYVDSCEGTAHSFSVMSVDAVGNVGEAAVQNFLVQAINTQISLANGNDGSNVSPSTTAVFNIGAVVDTSAPDKFTYEYKLNDGAWTQGKHFPKFGLRDLPEGSHTITARATSRDGCVDTTLEPYAFNVDLTSPVTVWNEGTCTPGSPYVTNETHAMLCGTVSDVNVKTTGSQYKLGNLPYTSAGNPLVTSSGAFCISLDNLVEGQYDVAFKSMDAAGNQGEESTCTVIVDGKIPDTLIEFGPATPSMEKTEGDYYVFGFSCDEGSCTFEYSINEQMFVPAVPSDLTPNYFVLSVPYTGFGKGVNTLKVVAIDAGGNRDPSPAYFTFTVMDATAYSEVADQFKWTFKMTEGSTGTSMKTFAFKNNMNHAYCIDSEC